MKDVIVVVSLAIVACVMQLLLASSLVFFKGFALILTRNGHSLCEDGVIVAKW